MNRELFFESAGDERATPQDFFDRLNAEFHFTIDAAASELNHKCDTWFGPGGLFEDALEADWGGEGTVAFLNSPYSVAGAFVAKAREEADKGATVVMLLPVRTDTRWWHDAVWDATHHMPRHATEVRFVRGRLQFELKVPAALRTLVKAEMQGSEQLPTDNYKELIEQLKEITGLPKMAIEGIRDDKPDEDLLSSAPFPSCVVIFTRAEP